MRVSSTERYGYKLSGPSARALKLGKISMAAPISLSGWLADALCRGLQPFHNFEGLIIRLLLVTRDLPVEPKRFVVRAKKETIPAQPTAGLRLLIDAGKIHAADGPFTFLDDGCHYTVALVIGPLS